MTVESSIMQAVVDAALPVAPSRRLLPRVSADQLRQGYKAPEVLVDGLLLQTGVSMLFGESNSGKTFLAVDIAAAIARGTDWMGMKVEPGPVLYLAVESPSSVTERVRAYQKHHNVSISDLHLVASSIDLFGKDSDVQAVIDTIKDVERQGGKPVRLVVGDTLSRLAAGANENAAQDMSRIMQRVERIANECSTHVMLIHHTGKDLSAGARGWSGIRAAVDTEMLVSTGAGGARCAEVTKQRDLSTRGKRIGFQLESVPMGSNKWNTATTTCIVAPATAPDKRSASRTSPLDEKIMSALRKDGPTQKSLLADRFKAGPKDRSNVYRRIEALSKRQQVTVDGDLVSLVQ